MKKICNYIKSIPRRIKNFFFCLKYPFYKARNVWTDKFVGYEFTWYDDIPEGWKKAFGKQLSKDLRKALKKEKFLYKFRFTQIKEKYGRLCLYCMSYGYYSEKVIDKYELLSSEICIKCGEKATHTTSGYVLHLCDNCFEEYIKKIKG